MQLIHPGRLMSKRKRGTASPPPVVTTYLLDTLTEASDLSLASHVSDSGHTWAPLPSNTGVFTIGGGADMRTTTANPRIMSSATTPDDSIIEVVMRRFSSVTNDQCGVYFNMTAGSTNSSITAYRFRFNNATLQLELDKLTASVVTQAIVALSFTPTSGNHTYKVIKTGAHFDILEDGVSVATGDDAGSPLVGGRIGVVGGANGGTSAGTHMDNLYVHS